MEAFCAHRVMPATGGSALHRALPLPLNQTLEFANNFTSPLLKNI
jgi:hypothetical protein